MTNKPKVMVFGSCMSNLTANHLVMDYGFEQTHSIHHNRSDTFIKYYIEKSDSMIPLTELESHLIYKKDTETEARQFLRNQYPQFMGFHDMQHKIQNGRTFFDDLKDCNFDIILLDNFMDIAAKLVYWKSKPDLAEKELFLNIGFYENESELTPQFWHTEYLAPEVSVRNWIRIYSWIRYYQPKSKIYFIPYHASTSLNDASRFERITNFHDLLIRNADIKNLKIMPQLNVGHGLTKGTDDWPHFTPEIYRALAGLLYLDYVADIIHQDGNKNKLVC